MFNCFGGTPLSIFEQARQNATYDGSANEPDPRDIEQILKCLKGEDLQTRQDQGFQKLWQSLFFDEKQQNQKNWIFLVKNLIIFDRIVEEKIFLEEMSKLHLPCFDNYKEKNPKYKKMKQFTSQQAKKTKDIYIRFLKNSDQFSHFLKMHNFIKEYDIVLPNDIHQQDKGIVDSLNNLIEYLEAEEQDKVESIQYNQEVDIIVNKQEKQEVKKSDSDEEEEEENSIIKNIKYKTTIFFNTCNSKYTFKDQGQEVVLDTFFNHQNTYSIEYNDVEQQTTESDKMWRETESLTVVTGKRITKSEQAKQKKNQLNKNQVIDRHSDEAGKKIDKQENEIDQQLLKSSPPKYKSDQQNQLELKEEDAEQEGQTNQDQENQTLQNKQDGDNDDLLKQQQQLQDNELKQDEDWQKITDLNEEKTQKQLENENQDYEVVSENKTQIQDNDNKNIINQDNTSNENNIDVNQPNEVN